MHLHFVKMQGLGNDFLVVRWPIGVPGPDANTVRRWADRRLGVGFDQLLTVDNDINSGVDAAYRVFNADGGEVEQCGNGVRCVARFLADETGKEELKLQSKAGMIVARVLPDESITVNLGEPSFDPQALPFQVESKKDFYQLDIQAEEIEFGAVSLGNPHAVIAVDSVDVAPVDILGPALGSHSVFPRGVNVGFVEITNQTQVNLRVFERGVGETPGCGTGAAAAVAVGRCWKALAENVLVNLPGGTLSVNWAGAGSPLWLRGPATRVYEGQIEL